MTGTSSNEVSEAAHQFRNHIQIIASLLHLHAGHLRSENVSDLLKKLQMRLEVAAETVLLTVGAPSDDAAALRLLEVIDKVVARIYRDDRRGAATFKIINLRTNAVTLATIGQIFAELLSNIYCRPGAAAKPVAVKIDRGADDRVTLSVRVVGVVPDENLEAVDPLTSKLIAGLAASVGGEIHFDKEAIYDARLTFFAPPKAG